MDFYLIYWIMIKEGIARPLDGRKEGPTAASRFGNTPRPHLASGTLPPRENKKSDAEHSYRLKK